MPNSPKLLDNFPLMRSHSIEEVRETLGRVYAKPALIPAQGVKTLDARMNYCPLGNVWLYYRKYGAGVYLDFPETAFFLKLIPLRGGGELTVGETSISLAPGATAIISPNMRWQLRCTADYEHLALKVDARALTRRLEALSGAPLGTPLEFDARQDSRCPTTQIMLRHLHSLADTLSMADANSRLPSWWVAQNEQLTLTMLLCCNRHAYSHVLDGHLPNAAPLEVRRAEDYIEANRDGSVTLEDLAEVTGVSALSLYRSFKKHRGYSPMEFLARTRSQRGET
jgi:hypothetical protein